MPRFAHIVTVNAVNDLTTKSLSSHSATRPHVDDVVFGVVGNAVKNSRNSEAHDKTDERQMLFYTISLLTSATKAQAKEWHPIEGIDLGFKLQMAFGSPVVAENYDCALIDMQGPCALLASNELYTRGCSRAASGAILLTFSAGLAYRTPSSRMPRHGRTL